MGRRTVRKLHTQQIRRDPVGSDKGHQRFYLDWTGLDHLGQDETLIGKHILG